jgi:hypothetical protein
MNFITPTKNLHLFNRDEVAEQHDHSAGPTQALTSMNTILLDQLVVRDDYRGGFVGAASHVDARGSPGSRIPASI